MTRTTSERGGPAASAVAPAPAPGLPPFPPPGGDGSGDQGNGQGQGRGDAPPQAQGQGQVRAASLPSNSSESHRVHLAALLRQERNPAYRRVDYLRPAHQTALWKREVRAALLRSSNGNGGPHLDDALPPLAPAPRRSPSSVANPIANDDAEAMDVETEDLAAAQGYVRGMSAATTARGGGCDPLLPPERPSEICVRWRDRIVEWMYQVVDGHELDRELVAVSAHYLDRYLALRYVDEKTFQLLAMACIYLATKVHSPKKVVIDAIAKTHTEGTITAAHVAAMELDVIKALGWHLHPPTAASFVDNLFPLLSEAEEASISAMKARMAEEPGGSFRALQLAHARRERIADALDLSRFLAELSVCAYPFLSARPSNVAVAAALCSLDHLEAPAETVDAFRSLSSNALGIDANRPEVRACAGLLRRVHGLAVPPGVPSDDRLAMGQITP